MESNLDFEFSCYGHSDLNRMICQPSPSEQIYCIPQNRLKKSTWLMTGLGVDLLF